MTLKTLKYFFFIFFLLYNSIFIITQENNEINTLLQIKKQQELFDLAQEFKYGLNGKNIDINKAIELLEQSGKEGNSEAFYELGQMFQVFFIFSLKKKIIYL